LRRLRGSRLRLRPARPGEPPPRPVYRVDGHGQDAEMTNGETLPLEELTARVEAIFLKAGLSADQAAAVAREIAAGERDGAKAHGIYRVEGCLNTLRAGKVSATAVPTVQDNGSPVIQVSAGGGFSCAAFELGFPILAERVRRLGLAALVINDAAHF